MCTVSRVAAARAVTSTDITDHTRAAQATSRVPVESRWRAFLASLLVRLRRAGLRKVLRSKTNTGRHRIARIGQAIAAVLCIAAAASRVVTHRQS